jgi:glycerol-3-phosphate cytidylyltransferase-like family protein
LDTREKIINLTRAAGIAAHLRRGGMSWKLVTGYFDVLTPDHIRGLNALANCGMLMAIVLDPPDPLLASRARSELAASLRVVDYVILLGSAGLDQAIHELQPDEVIRTETTDQQRSQALIEHVHRRNRS